MSTDTIIERSPQFDVDLREIRKHYDRLSIFYRLLWGEHLHHGYWENGESIGRAQIKLMEQLAEKAGIPRGAQVLDIGCGLGGSAFWLANQYDCRVTGLTISPVQARMATKRAKSKGLLIAFDFWWSTRMCGNRSPKARTSSGSWRAANIFATKRLFRALRSALKPGGVLAVCAWLRGEQSTRDDGKN